MKPERIAELRQSAGYGDDFDRQAELVECLDAIESLQAELAELPTLADGVPVTPSLIDNDVWAHATPLGPDLGEPWMLTVQQIHSMEYDTEVTGFDVYGKEHTVDCEDCYSTEAAARAGPESEVSDER